MADFVDGRGSFFEALGLIDGSMFRGGEVINKFWERLRHLNRILPIYEVERAIIDRFVEGYAFSSTGCVGIVDWSCAWEGGC